MRKNSPIPFLGTLLLCSGLFFFPAAADETLEAPPFGTVHLTGDLRNPVGVILFFSGDGGWNAGVKDMADDLGKEGYFVAGIDIRQYFKHFGAGGPSCVYAAGDVETFSQSLQKKYKLPVYLPPVLIGYSSGATLAYAIAAQSPPGTFSGALSMGFCPDLETTHPLCAQNGLTYEKITHPSGYVYKPVPRMTIPWVAFQGDIDQVCSPDFAAKYTSQIPGSKLEALPKVGHGFSVRKNWWPAYLKDIHELSQAHKAKSVTEQLQKGEKFSDEQVKNLPLVIQRVSGKQPPYFAILYSGDGGWADVDQSIAKAFLAKGIPVVGMNSLQYLWSGKTPAQTSADLAAIIRNFSALFGADSVVLVGYSRGADMAPLMLNGLPADLLKRVRQAVLIAPSTTAELEFHVLDWVSDSKDGYSVKNEVKRLEGKIPLHLICGKDEDNTSLCQYPREFSKVRMTLLPGGHHFKGNYDLLSRTIFSKLP